MEPGGFVRGMAGLAVAWKWHIKSVQALRTRAAKSPTLYRWFLQLERKGDRVHIEPSVWAVYSKRHRPNAEYLVPRCEVDQLYKDYILDEKVDYAPYPPGSGKKTGTRNWGRRLPFSDPRDEELYQQHLREQEQNRREHERYVHGNYNEHCACLADCRAASDDECCSWTIELGE